MKDLQVGCPDLLTIIHLEKGGRKKEAEFHACFSDSRIRGEWFSYNPEISEFLYYARTAEEFRREQKEQDDFEEQLEEHRYKQLEEEYYQKLEEEHQRYLEEGQNGE